MTATLLMQAMGGSGLGGTLAGSPSGTAYGVSSQGQISVLPADVEWASALGFYPVGFAGAGNRWFANEVSGSDSNPGTWAQPFATLDAAQAAASSGDTVYLVGSSHRTTTLVWSTSNVNLVGVNAPSNNNRARISCLSVASGMTQTLATALHPLVSVTGQGCAFVNISAFYGFDGSTITPPAAAVCWADTGGRNYYGNCQFLGGDALTSALAGFRFLTLGGNGENLLENCTIGDDTVQRITNANASLEIVGGSPRNRIRNALFQMWNGLAANEHVLIASGGMDRYLALEGCKFHSFGTQVSAAISNAGGSPGGDVILDSGTIVIGAAAIATSGNVYGADGALGATTWGIGGLLT